MLNERTYGNVYKAKCFPCAKQWGGGGVGGEIGDLSS